MATSCVEYQVGESIKVPIWYDYSTRCECRSAYSQFHFCNVDCTCGNPNSITVSKCNGSSLVVYSQVYRNVNLLTGSCSNVCSPYCEITYCNDTDLVQIVDYCAYFVNTCNTVDDGCHYTQASILPIKFLVNPHNSVTIPPVVPACAYSKCIWFAFQPDRCTSTDLVASLMLTRTIRAYPLPSPTNGNTWDVCCDYYYDGGAKQPKWFSTNCINIPIVSNDGSPSIGCAYACTHELCGTVGYSIPDQIRPVIGTDESDSPFTLARYSPCVTMSSCTAYTCDGCKNATGFNRDALVGIYTPEMAEGGAISGAGSCTLSNSWCTSSTWNRVKSYMSRSFRAYSPCIALGSTSNAVTLNDEVVEPKGPNYDDVIGDWVYYKDAFSVRCSCSLPSWGCGSCTWTEDPILIYKGIDFNPTCEDGFTCVAFVSCIVTN